MATTPTMGLVITPYLYFTFVIAARFFDHLETKLATENYDVGCELKQRRLNIILCWSYTLDFINIDKRAGPVAGMKVQRCRCKLKKIF